MDAVVSRKVKITDTTLRDAHQSLIATRLRTEDMLPLARDLDQCGFFSVEAWGGATFDTCIRFLNDDPWDRLRALKGELKHTPIQMLLRGQNLVGYRHYPDDVVDKFVAAAHKNGVDVFRVFDALNDIRNMTRSMDQVKKAGAHLQGTICYTTSPVHNNQTFIRMAKDLYALECDSICIKDMAGLIMPEAARNLISGIKKAVDVKVCLHSHCTSGIAPMAYQAAIEAGVDILDTAMSPFAMGTSQPPTESIVASLIGTPCDTGIDLIRLRAARNACIQIREKYAGLLNPISERVDSNVLLYQLPGGMISNLVSQLQEQDALNRLDTLTLRKALLAVNGIGPETADDIVLYAFHRPVFVIDAYTRRLLTRLGLIEGDESYEELRAICEKGLARWNKILTEEGLKYAEIQIPFQKSQEKIGLIKGAGKEIAATVKLLVPTVTARLTSRFSSC